MKIEFLEAGAKECPLIHINGNEPEVVGRLIRAGMKEVHYLDAIMHNKYSRDPDKLRACARHDLICED